MALYAPSIFNRGWNDIFDSFNGSTADLMKTDIKENDDNYEVVVNLPGIKKDDVKLELKNGYLTVNASTSSESEDSDKDGKYLRKERFEGSCSRSFYVGDKVEEDDIHAKFDNGVLTIDFAKPEKKQIVEKDHMIAID